MHRPRFVRPTRAAIVALCLAVPSAPRLPAQGTTPRRVVCVSKQLNEFMFAIGAEGVIVGRDLTSIYPPQITRLPSVGYHRALSAEGILSLKPTLLLTDGNVGPEPVMAQVKQVGLPVLELKPGNSPEEAQALLTRLGDEFGRAREAAAVIATWKKEMEALARDTVRYNQGARPRVLVMHFGQIVNNYLAVTRGGAADQLIRWAGGTNAVDSVGGMMRLTPELIAKAAPDIIIATDVGFDRAGSAAQFATMPGVALTPAAKAGRIYRIDETELLYYGPRTPASVRKLAGWFHPR
ncbi:MAG: ABC transporter substrate-binding protein [Gemmatimonadetes bacterium]|nr:ABC transporter substrate-binding protein [Gemmatimonadota bacterium]